MAKNIRVTLKARIAVVEGIENGQIVMRETVCNGLRSEMAILKKIHSEFPEFAPARKISEHFTTEKYEVNMETFLSIATKITEE